MFALHGLGGIGKSTVAAELAHCAVVRELFPDGVLWATLGLQPQIGSLLTSWVRGVGERPTEAWADASATAFLRTVLRERRVLLVVDDVWHEDHIQPFLVGGPNCCVLMTTRRAAIADQVGATLVPVNELDPDESIVLMARRAGARGVIASSDEHEARLLTQQLGHLPLAIELVGALVARRYSWAEARRQLIAFENGLPADDSSRSHAQRKLEVCLGLSFAVLRSESLALWQAFAYFCLIPHEQRITASIAATLWNVSLEHAQRWLHALEDDAFLRRAPGGYALHSLLHQMAETLFCRGHPDGLGMSLTLGHKELVQRYLATAATGHWADIRDDGYIIDRWTWHLVQADQGDAVFELLGANDADGKNRWYQRRNKIGRLSGYLDDLRLARQVALGKRSRWQQIFVALCHSSVLSGTANYSGDLVFALVRRGIWSPVWAFRWAEQVCIPERRVECLLAITSATQVVGVRDKPQDPLVVDAARQALLLAQSLIAARPPTDAAVQLMSRAVGIAAVHEQLEAITSALTWCKSAGHKAKFLGLLPTSIAHTTLEALSAQLNAADNPLVWVLLMTQLIRRSTADARKAAGTRLTDALATVLPPQTDSLLRRVAKAASQTLSMSAATSEDLADTDSYGVHIEVLCDALGASLPLLPNDLQDRAASQLRAHRGHPRVQQLLEMLGRIRNLPRREVNAKEVDQFDWLNPDAQRKIAADSLVARGDPAQVLAIAHTAIEGGWEVDEFMVWIGTLPATIEPSILRDIASVLSKRNPQALCPQLILSTEAVSLSEVVRRIHQASVYSAARIAVACMLYAAPDMATEALAAFSRIHDRNEQVRAMLAILPFLPPGANRSHFVDLENAELAGAQIAGMTAMMVELSRAIDASALAEVVEATSKVQSEWWVVEALSVTLLRVGEVSELKAIVEAAKCIRNLDLRARLLERVAIRLADLRVDTLAIDVAGSIELSALRWAALRDLGVRFASTGNLKSAKQAVALIIPRGLSQKAFVDIAMELGALEMSDAARELITEHVVDGEWKAYAAPIFSNGAANMRLAAERQYERAIGEKRLSQYDMVATCAQDIASLLGTGSVVERVVDAALHRNSALLEAAVLDMWRAPGNNGELLVDSLSRLQRRHALVILAQIAPTMDICADPGEVARIVETIHHVSRWWP